MAGQMSAGHCCTRQPQHPANPTVHCVACCCQVVELAGNARVEVCWYFPTSREQYRLSGTAQIVAVDHGDQQLLQARQQAWAKMSDAGETASMWNAAGCRFGEVWDGFGDIVGVARATACGA
jgi:hypothetical protein